MLIIFASMDLNIIFFLSMSSQLANYLFYKNKTVKKQRKNLLGKKKKRKRQNRVDPR